MAESGIKFTYLSGGPDSITSIICLSSSPKLKGTIRLNTFTGLTSFDGGDNGLEAVTGFSQLTALSSFRINGANTVGFDISALPVNLETFSVLGSNTIIGNFVDLPNNLTNFTLEGNNTVGGDIQDLPASLVYYNHKHVGGLFSSSYLNSSKTGNLSSIQAIGLSTFNCFNANTITGDISSLKVLTPDLQILNIGGSNTVTGSIEELPDSLTSFTLLGSINQTTYGNISGLPPNLIIFDNRGRNTVTGTFSNMPSGLEVLRIVGFLTTVGGPLSSLTTRNNLKVLQTQGPGRTTGNFTELPLNLEEFRITSSNDNETTGSLADLPRGLKIFQHRTPILQNTVTGTFSQLPSGLELFDVLFSTQTITGSAISLPRQLEVYRNSGRGFITGNFEDLPVTLTELNTFSTVGSANTLSGNLSALPRGLTIWQLWNFADTNSTVGNVKDMPRGMVEFQDTSNNSNIFGAVVDLPRSLTRFRVNRVDNLNGELRDLPPAGQDYRVTANQINGDLKDLPRLFRRIALGVGNTVFGSLTSLPTNRMSFIEIANNGNKIWEYYDGATHGYNKFQWPDTMELIHLAPALKDDGSVGMPPAHLATLIIDFSGKTWDTSDLVGEFTPTIEISGSRVPTLNLLDPGYGAPLSAAIVALSAQGVTVSLNLTSI